ncbi:MAG: NAD-dependent epimerase/dehydratase family protein [Deltaproteobacteria bacterium]|nr:NAD-dependent epimerase/dehydratase family protein [Deltaproteobacteria bacterium]
MSETNVEGKVLITGASGFIGSRLRDALLDGGADVLAVRRPGSPPAERGRSVELSYDDEAAVEAMMDEERPDYVFHVAGVTKGVTYEDFRRGNVMPTRNLARAAARVAPKRFVLVSSLAAYGPAKGAALLEESHPRRPIEHYGRSKLEAEEALESVEGLRTTIVRPSGVYGPGDVDYFQLFLSAQRGFNVYFGNEARRFSAIYVDDCVRAILMSATSEESLGRGYFLTDDLPTTWGEFQQRVVRHTPRRVRTLRLPEALVTLAAHGGELLTRLDGKPRLLNRQKAIMSAQESWTCSGAAARRDFGFEAEVDQEQGVERSAAWYREHGWL